MLEVVTGGIIARAYIHANSQFTYPITVLGVGVCPSKSLTATFDLYMSAVIVYLTHAKLHSPDGAK